MNARSLQFPFGLARKARRPAAGFSLLELLLTLGLIGALLAAGVRGSFTGRTGGLRSAQAVVASLMQAGRTKALVTGQACRLLFHVDPSAASEPSRFLSYVALQTQGPAGWEAVTEVFLPDGVYVVPGISASQPAGLFAPAPSVPWSKADGSDLRSTALRSSQLVTEAVAGAPAERYVALGLSAFGTTAQSGDLVFAAGHRRAPGSFAEGESPVELVGPGDVRGLTVSTYGVTVFVGNRDSF